MLLSFSFRFLTELLSSKNYGHGTMGAVKGEGRPQNLHVQHMTGSAVHCISIQ